MNLPELSIFILLLVISGWLGYLNYRILKISEDILNLTKNIDRVTTHMATLTTQIVANTSMPSDFPD